MIRKIVGWPLAHLLYGIGVAAYWCIDRTDTYERGEWDREEPGKLWQFGFDTYSWAMVRSCNVNDWAGLDLWKKVPDDTV